MSYSSTTTKVTTEQLIEQWLHGHQYHNHFLESGKHGHDVTNGLPTWELTPARSAVALIRVSEKKGGERGFLLAVMIR